MNLKWFGVFVLFFPVSIRTLGQPVVYHVDNVHSSLQFTVPFFGVSEVPGRFDQFCGTFTYDREKQSRIELYIAASSINTGTGMRDKDLRENYFESAKFPIIRFISTEIKEFHTKEFEVTGTLSLHGTAKEIHIKLMTVGEIDSPDGKEWGLKSSPIVIDRTSFGISKGQLSGDRVFVGNSVTISSVMRLRENTLEKKQFEKTYPAINQEGLGKFTGTYRNDSKSAEIKLLVDQNQLFVLYKDEDFTWMHEAKKTGTDQARILSFKDLIELKENAILLKEMGKEDVAFVKK
jgi:polyisoprenoid-binding protein YceI